MNGNQDKGLRIAGGVCAILWPLLSQFLFFALYPVLARNSEISPVSDLETFLWNAAELAQNSAIVALEWSKMAMSLLLLPFLLALYKTLYQRGRQNLVLLALGLGLIGMAFTMLGDTFNSTINHALGREYVNAGSNAGGADIVAMVRVFFSWHKGINQVGSLLYQGCVGLISVALIRANMWRGWGWVGLVGSALALVAKLTPGLQGVTNFTWTGLAYFLWPAALGIGLLRMKEKER